MLTEICAELRNYFLVDKDRDIHSGTFTILDGSIDLPFLQEGQYFRIVGSALNDGVWQYPIEQLKDEVFTGAVWAMGVPPSFIALVAQIEQWQEDNAAVLASPYQSEAFGGYSYNLKTGGNGNNAGSGYYTWRDQFAAKLAPYRRLFAV